MSCRFFLGSRNVQSGFYIGECYHYPLMRKRMNVHHQGRVKVRARWVGSSTKHGICRMELPCKFIRWNILVTMGQSGLAQASQPTSGCAFTMFRQVQGLRVPGSHNREEPCQLPSHYRSRKTSHRLPDPDSGSEADSSGGRRPGLREKAWIQ